MYDLKIINAKTWNNANLVSIGIKGNKIADIGDSLPEDAKEIVDAKVWSGELSAEETAR